MTNDLIISIGKQLNIPRSDDNEWACQIVYSVAGQMALASLWDHSEGSGSVSVQYFKNRISQIFDAYETICPEIGFLLPEDKTCLINEIYSIYLRNGFFYHSAYQVSPAAPAASTVGNLTLYRGNSPDLKLFMSGLGFYSTQKSNYNGNVEKCFVYKSKLLKSILKNCWSVAIGKRLIGRITRSFFGLTLLSYASIGNRPQIETGAYHSQDMVNQTEFLLFTDMIMECINTNQSLNGDCEIISQTRQVTMANIEESQ